MRWKGARTCWEAARTPWEEECTRWEEARTRWEGARTRPKKFQKTLNGHISLKIVQIELVRCFLTSTKKLDVKKHLISLIWTLFE